MGCFHDCIPLPADSYGSVSIYDHHVQIVFYLLNISISSAEKILHMFHRHIDADRKFLHTSFASSFRSILLLSILFFRRFLLHHRFDLSRCGFYGRLL